MVKSKGREGAIRIVGGRWRGTRLLVPDIDGLRPSADRVRETLFNWLMPVLPGARVLDLFAGSGALGLESISRGAAAATLVERDAGLINGAWLNYCQFSGCTPQQVSIPWGVIQPLTWVGLIIAWIAQDLGHLFMDRKHKRRRKAQPNPWPLILAALAVGLVVLLHQQGLL